MSSNVAKETLLETFRNLLTCDADVKRDFIIESEDRDGEMATLHVHSSILTMRFDSSLNNKYHCLSFAQKILGHKCSAQ